MESFQRKVASSYGDMRTAQQSPKIRAFEAELRHAYQNATLSRESAMDRIRQEVKNATSGEECFELLCAAAWGEDVVFAVELADEAGLAPTYWARFIRTIFEYDAEKAIEAFPFGILKHPLAQKLFFIEGTGYIPEQMAGAFERSSMLENDARQVLVHFSAKFPLVFAAVSPTFLSRQFSEEVATECKDLASQTLQKMALFDLGAMMKQKVALLTRELVKQSRLREEIQVLRKAFYERLLARIPGHAIQRFSETAKVMEEDFFSPLSVRAFKDSVQDVLREIMKVGRAEIRAQELYMSIFLVCEHISEEPEEVFQMAKNVFPEKDRVFSGVDGRLVIERACVEAEQDTKRGVNHGFIHRVTSAVAGSFPVDQEDRDWRMKKITDVAKYADSSNSTYSLAEKSALLVEVLRWSIVAGVPPKHHWWRTVLASNSLVVFNEPDAATFLKLLPLSWREEWIRAVIRSNEQMPLSLYALTQCYRFAEEWSCSSATRNILQKGVHKIFTAILGAAVTGDQAFSSWIAKFMKSEVVESSYGYKMHDVIRLHYALRGLHPDDQKACVDVLEGAHSYSDSILAALPRRWGKLQQHPNGSILQKITPVGRRYLTEEGPIERYIEEASSWSMWLKERLKRDHWLNRTVPKDPDAEFTSAMRDSRGAMWISITLSLPPHQALALNDRLDPVLLKINSEYPEVYQNETALRFVDKRYDEIQALVQRVDSNGLAQALLLSVLRSQNHEQSLSEVSRLVDEFEAPGDEAEHLAHIIVSLVSQMDASRREGLQKLLVGRAQNEFGRKDSQVHLDPSLIAERLRAILHPSLEQVIEAYRRVKRLKAIMGPEGPIVDSADLLHWTTVDGLKGMLRQGNICGEALGVNAKVDSYPLHLDAIAVGPVVAGKTLREAMRSHHLWYMELPVAVVYPHRDRSGAFAYGEEFDAPNSDIAGHKLLFMGLPKTEAGYVMIHASVASQNIIEEVKMAVVQGGCYLPVLLTDGTCVLEEGEFMERYLKVKPYGSIEQFLEDRVWMEEMDREQNDTHEHRLGEHLLLAETYAVEYAKRFSLDVYSAKIVRVAARLHDVGKFETGPQALTNVAAAEQLLDRVRHISRDVVRAVRRLIHHDELLGVILQDITKENGQYVLGSVAKKELNRFYHIFPNSRDQSMLLALYLADVRAIGKGRFEEWEVESKLRWLELLPQPR